MDSEKDWFKKVKREGITVEGADIALPDYEYAFNYLESKTQIPSFIIQATKRIMLDPGMQKYMLSIPKDWQDSASNRRFSAMANIGAVAGFILELNLDDRGPIESWTSKDANDIYEQRATLPKFSEEEIKRRYNMDQSELNHILIAESQKIREIENNT